MVLRDLHTHTTFCDGKNTPEEMVQAAIARGMTTLGFSGHGYAPYDGDACIKESEMQLYYDTITQLKAKYAGEIEILCGIEKDYFSPDYSQPFDYVIGSVHYVMVNGEYVSIDSSADNFKAGCEKYFGGDYYAFAEKYFDTVSNVVNKTKCDIIGHFDLFCKFNEKHSFFSEEDERYVSAWTRAADRLLETGAVFEINTGAIGRGYKTVPYPSKTMREYIKARGGRFILSSDSHRAETLLLKFDELENEI